MLSTLTEDVRVKPAQFSYCPYSKIRTWFYCPVSDLVVKKTFPAVHSDQKKLFTVHTKHSTFGLNCELGFIIPNRVQVPLLVYIYIYIYQRVR